jgi:hypothetical protein
MTWLGAECDVVLVAMVGKELDGSGPSVPGFTARNVSLKSDSMVNGDYESGVVACSVRRR